MSKYIPTAPAITREALTVIAGALLAAAVIAYFPEVKAWIKRQWD